MDNISSSLLFILGIGVFGGMIGAWFFQKIKFPQVVGYIAIGLLLGESGFKIVSSTDVVNLKVFNLFALGIIGFLVGGELKIETFRKYAKQFIAILLGEGLLAFFLVGGLSFVVVYCIIPSFPAALAASIVFGAIASATDPASTIDVIWEYRSKGVMTTAIIAIVALDDALAMTLYGLGTSSAQMLTSNSGSISAELFKIGVELIGALVVGGLFSLILAAFMRWLPQAERGAAVAVGLILLLISVAAYFDMDVILAAMSLGFGLANLVPRRSEDLFKLMRSFSVPIYVLFFVLVGARLGLGKMPGWLWGIVAVYVVGRSAGKMIGAYLGARITGSDPAIRKYLGLGLFAQGGVAVGLSIMAAEHLSGIRITDSLNLGDMIIFVITATTLVVQVLGPPMVKLAVKLSGEAGRDITEQDVIARLSVRDVMDADKIVIRENASVRAAVEQFHAHEMLLYPVVDGTGNIVGVLTFEALKDVLINRDTWDWLLVADIMRPLVDMAYPDDKLEDIYERMTRLKIDQMPVVDTEANRPLGMLDVRSIRMKVNAELLDTNIDIPVESVA